MRSTRRYSLAIVAVVILACPLVGSAQSVSLTTAPDSTPAKAAAPAAPALDFSGILFANFPYRGDKVRRKARTASNYLNGSEWKALARVGLLHTVFIDEQFWARWISPTPTEKAGYFASADAGLATSVTLPAKLGEFTQPRPTDPVTHRARLTGSRTTLRDFRSRRGHRWMEE